MMARILYDSDVYFQVYRDSVGLWRWRARAWNHEIVASGEGYFNRYDCLRAIEMMKGSGDGPVNQG